MRKQTKVVVTVSVLLILLLISGYFWFFWSPLGVVLRGPMYEGILRPAEKLWRTDPTPVQIRRRALRGIQPPWDPTHEQIEMMESLLQSYVTERRDLFGDKVVDMLPHYKRYYSGLTRKGKPFIYVTMYSPTIVSRRTWLNGVLIGGNAAENNWSVRFDPATKTFYKPYPFERMAKRKGISNKPSEVVLRGD